MKNLNYTLDVIVTVTINIKDTTPIIINDFEFCKLPIQVLSKQCNLHYLENNHPNDYKYELYNKGECINELGGYFIINGKEKVIISQERLAYNKLYTHKDQNILITEVKSQKRNSFIPARNTYVKLKNVRTKKKNLLNVEEEVELEEEITDVFIDDDDLNTVKEKVSNINIYVSFPGVKIFHYLLFLSIWL